MKKALLNLQKEPILESGAVSPIMFPGRQGGIVFTSEGHGTEGEGGCDFMGTLDQNRNEREIHKFSNLQVGHFYPCTHLRFLVK